MSRSANLKKSTMGYFLAKAELAALQPHSYLASLPAKSGGQTLPLRVSVNSICCAFLEVGNGLPQKKGILAFNEEGKVVCEIDGWVRWCRFCFGCGVWAHFCEIHRCCLGECRCSCVALVQMEVPNSLNRLCGLGPRVQSSTCSALSQVYASVSDKRQPGPVKMTKSPSTILEWSQSGLRAAGPARLGCQLGIHEKGGTPKIVLFCFDFPLKQPCFLLNPQNKNSRHAALQESRKWRGDLFKLFKMPKSSLISSWKKSSSWKNRTTRHPQKARSCGACWAAKGLESIQSERPWFWASRLFD